MKKIDNNYFLMSANKNINSASIDSILNENEKILWRGKPLRKSFLLNAILKQMFFAIIWLCFDAGFLTVFFLFLDEIPTIMIVFIVVFFIFHLMPVWIWIFGIISASKKQKIEEYAFTDTRILIKQGFVGSSVISIFYSSLTSVNLKVGVIEKMCHVGDIYIVAGTQKVVLQDIENPSFIVGQLQGLANDIKSDIYYPNSLRSDNNPGYHSKYTGQYVDIDRKNK